MWIICRFTKNFMGAGEFHLNDEEKLKAENDFLKMKLMLEKGANFGSSENKELPAEIENEFLKNVMKFEQQFQEQKQIKVFDKIGRPQHFKPVNDIPDNKINKAWSDLLDYLHKYNIDLDVCSPNISTKELYRFATEELFEHEMDDMDLPGWMTNFIYDEFHPDPVYDNTRAAEESIRFILKKEPLEFMYHFRSKNLQLNEHASLTEEECKKIVNRFKLAYDDLEINEISVLECIVNETESLVTGTYNVSAASGSEAYQLSGNWKVVFEKDEEAGYWYINAVDIGDIKF